ncbi:MAG: trypsin-like peptidase domain-containing protein [Winogradskyella sp.]|uniref:trypsin-like serine peptidase n=1 Tax=Winogradskyella sp. TaxID=1883156 RepID=UPI0025D8C921|nr:serine protease [Winogradskyella sp.]NRB58948.1 trypsin-like peptidase domain-containing protein [Winogradskyella sp.]
MPPENNFPDQISIETIRASKFDGIAYQNVRRNRRGERDHHSTSFFISRNFLLTSAHNVSGLIFGLNKPNKLSIYPSKIGNDEHLGSIIYNIGYRRNISIAPGYSFRRRRTHISHDMALIYIPEEIVSNNRHLDNLPILPILEDLTSLEEGEPVYCAGYPAADEYADQFIMTLDESTLGRIRNSSFKHNLDTKRGNSGSPIMVKRNSEYHVIGINSIRHNGTLIKDSKKRWIQSTMERMTR